MSLTRSSAASVSGIPSCARGDIITSRLPDGQTGPGSTAKHITELLERYNCNDLEGFLNVTHALSLNDTFWVKPETSPLKWDDVSLYRNEFDELVAAAAFDGRIGSTSFRRRLPSLGRMDILRNAGYGKTGESCFTKAEARRLR